MEPKDGRLKEGLKKCLPWVPALQVRVERAQRRRGPPVFAMPSAFATSN